MGIPIRWPKQMACRQPCHGLHVRLYTKTDSWVSWQSPMGRNRQCVIQTPQLAVNSPAHMNQRQTTLVNSSIPSLDRNLPHMAIFIAYNRRSLNVNFSSFKTQSRRLFVIYLMGSHACNGLAVKSHNTLPTYTLTDARHESLERLIRKFTS